MFNDLELMKSEKNKNTIFELQMEAPKSDGASEALKWSCRKNLNSISLEIPAECLAR